MNHVWYKCECGRAGCMFCDGGLGSCTVCGGLEGSLPKGCPGRKMTDVEQALVYGGLLDYSNGMWTVPWDKFIEKVVRGIDDARRRSKDVR